MTGATSTITHGPLAYDKPKGLAALLLPLLCPPTDFLDMQKLMRRLIRAFVSLSVLLVSMCCVAVPAWLLLVRHEAAAGHTGDAVLVAVGGLLLFLTADAANKAAAKAAAERGSLVTASPKLAERLALRSPSTASPLGVAPAAGSNGTRGSGGSAAPANGGNAAARGPYQGGALAGAAGSQDALVRQVKQRIIRLEHLVFGNELREADLSPEALHSRVLTLCTEVGVQAGGGARSSLADLDQQLRALERELLGT